MKQTVYTDNLKMSLLKPLNTAQECELLGGRYFIRRLSALALLEQEEKATQAFEAGDMRQASLLNVQMLLDCLCDPDGQPIPPEALPTADALMAAHDNGTLLDAIATVKRHAVGSLEDAQKKLTDSPWLYFLFQLAERLGEADIRKLAALPASQLLHWQAYLLMQAAPPDPLPVNRTSPPAQPAVSSVEAQCAAVMRALE